MFFIMHVVAQAELAANVFLISLLLDPKSYNNPARTRRRQ